jgi:hypothetical protein
MHEGSSLDCNWVDHFGPTKLVLLALEQVKTPRKRRFSHVQQRFCFARPMQRLALGSIWYYQFDQEQGRAHGAAEGGFCVDEPRLALRD